jgi:hypothetical protein
MKLVAAVDYQGKQEVQTYHEGVEELRGYCMNEQLAAYERLAGPSFLLDACMVSTKLQVTICSAQGTSASSS